MNCRQAKDKIRQKLDGTLGPEDQARLEEHLERCPKCRRELATLAATVEWLGDLEPVRAPVGFDDQVLRRVRQERQRAPERVGWAEALGFGFQRYLRPAAAGLVLLVVVALVGPALVQVASSYLTPRLAEPLARGTVRLVELAGDPDEIEALSDRARTISSPIGLVGRSVYRGLLDLIVPIAMWCTMGVAGIGLVWWVSRYSIQRRTRDARLVPQ